MLSFGRPRAVWLCVEAVDGRKGLDGLYGIVKEDLGQDPQNGSVFVFINRRHNRLKLIFCDDSGQCLFLKRLERGGFRWPKITGARTVEIKAGQLALLLGGLEPVVRARPGWWRGLIPAVSVQLLQRCRPT